MHFARRSSLAVQVVAPCGLRNSIANADPSIIYNAGRRAVRAADADALAALPMVGSDPRPPAAVDP